MVKDVMTLRAVPGNEHLIPSLRIFAILKEGFYDCLKKRVVKKSVNLTETHLTSTKVFELLKDRIHENYDKLDKDFTDSIIVQFSVAQKYK